MVWTIDQESILFMLDQYTDQGYPTVAFANPSLNPAAGDFQPESKRGHVQPVPALKPRQIRNRRQYIQRVLLIEEPELAMNIVNKAAAMALAALRAEVMIDPLGLTGHRSISEPVTRGSAVESGGIMGLSLKTGVAAFEAIARHANKAFFERFTSEYDGGFAHQAEIEAILSANPGLISLLEDLLRAFRAELGNNVYFELDVRHPNEPYEPLLLSIRLKQPLEGQRDLGAIIDSVCAPYEERIMAIEPGLDVMRGFGKPKRRFDKHVSKQPL